MIEIVDFWAEWCTPCKMMTPIIEELKNKYEGKVTVTEINVDEQPEESEKYGVMSIPTYLIRKDGQEVARLIGAVGKAPLEEKIKENLN
jgi:thioredoxin 1